MRIHIRGASGSGTTTLGSALAELLGVPHVDADTLFWLPIEAILQQLMTDGMSALSPTPQQPDPSSAQKRGRAVDRQRV